MENQWFVAAKKADFDAVAEQFHISPVLARIIRNRDVRTKEEVALFLHGTMSDLPDPFLLPDMEPAVRKLYGTLHEAAEEKFVDTANPIVRRKSAPSKL